MCLAIPGRITEVFRENDVLMGRIDFGGVRKQICLEYLPDIAIGDYALVHVGFAIARVDEKEAAQNRGLYEEELGGEYFYESDGSVADW